jgi:hypothetical protein
MDINYERLKDEGIILRLFYYWPVGNLKLSNNGSNNAAL